MNKKTDSVSNYKQTVDFSRIQSAKKHREKNSVITTGRECLHNATEYGADDILMFNAKKQNECYLIIAHNGKPFESKEDMDQAMKFNLTGGRGVQGSGGKTSMFCTVDNNNDAEFLLHSKCNDKNTHTLSLKLNKGNTSDAITVDKSQKMNSFLMAIMNKNNPKNDPDYMDIYDRYSVIYMYRYNTKNIKYNENSITHYSQMNMLMCISNEILKKVNENKLDLRYIPDNTLGEDKNGKITTIATKRRVPIKTPFMTDDFLVKKFKFLVENYEWEDPDGNIIRINAEFILRVYGNFRYVKNGEYKGLLSRERLSNGDKPYYSNEHITKVDDYNKLGLLVYQGIPLPGKNTSRANNEPVYFKDQKIARHSFDDLGAKRPSSSQKEWDVNMEKLYEYLNNDEDLINKLDLSCIKSWTPNVNMEIKILEPSDPNKSGPIDPHSFGSYDNLFYVGEPHVLKDLIKDLLTTSASKQIDELDKYNTYIPDYINENDELNLLGFKDVKRRNDPKIKVVIQEKSFEKMRNGGLSDIKRKGHTLKQLPVGMDEYLEVKLYEDGNPNPINVRNDNEIQFNNFGINIRKSGKGNSEGIFEIITDDYFHIDKNDVRHTHQKSQHKNSVNYFPKRKNKLMINGKEYRVSFDINVVNNKSQSGNSNSKTKTKKGDDSANKNIYFQDPSKKLLAKWDNKRNIPLLNSERPEITSFAENLEKHQKRFDEIYDRIKILGNDIFLNRMYKSDYDLTGRGNDNFQSDYKDWKHFVFNMQFKVLLDNNSDVKLLRKEHKKYITSVENDDAKEKEEAPKSIAKLNKKLAVKTV